MSKEFRYVVSYNTATRRWAVDEFEFSDGNIWDSAEETWTRGTKDGASEEYAANSEVLYALLEDFNQYLDEAEDEADYLDMMDEVPVSPEDYL